MANNNSTKKRIRQNEKRRLANSAFKSSVRSSSKRVLKLISSKEEVTTDELNLAHSDFIKKVDKASKRNVYHWKKAARLKSRMAKKVNAFGK